MRWATPEAAHRLRPFAKRIAKIALGVLCVGLLAFLTFVLSERQLSIEELDNLASEAELVESFELVMHTSDESRDVFRLIRKWTRDIPVYFDPSVPEWHRRVAEHQIGLLARLSGLKFIEIEAYDPENAVNLVLAESLEAKEQAAEKFLRWDKPLTGLEESVCFALVPVGDDGEIRKALAVFGVLEQSALSATCIIEELIHTLGTLADRATYEPSIFSDYAAPVEIPLNDKILIRALYDPKIKPGMSHWETRKLIPDIIHRLVVGVKARGEKSLYQR